MDESKRILVLLKNGKSKVYNPQFDITIHCVNESDQDDILNKLRDIDKMQEKIAKITNIVFNKHFDEAKFAEIRGILSDN